MSAFPEAATGFLPLALEHLGPLHGWLPQVQAHHFSADRGATRFVLTLARQPAGYVQAYRVGPAGDYAPWHCEAGDTWGMNLLLGEVADTWRGWGTPAIRAFVKFWRRQRPDLRRMLADLDARNLPAVRAYQKAGFNVLDAYGAPPKRLLILALNL